MKQPRKKPTSIPFAPLPTLAPLQPPPSFITAARTLNIELSTDELGRLGSYLALLLEANTRFNLTSVTDPEQAWSRHILDSLTLIPILASVDAKLVADLGSGGGLPGIPLAIAMPDVRFTLIESTGKKAAFLRAVIDALGLTNVTVRDERAEILGQDHHGMRESQDVFVARAVGRLPALIELAMPFLKVSGLLLAMKGRQAEAEIADAKPALHALHAHVIDRLRPLSDGESEIIVIEKQRKTPRIYPRQPGEAARRPIH